MRHTFTLDSIHKTYISQISLFTLRKNVQPQVKKALSGVSITLTPGLYGLLGPNGAGKSTLIHIITGTLAPDSGEVLWCGKPATGIAFRRILGYMPRQQGLDDSYTLRLDEPTAGPDPIDRVRLRELLADMAKDRIILVATHVVSDVETVATKVILLRAGKIVDAAPVPELIEKYAPDQGLEDVYLNVFGEGDGK